MGSSMTEGTPEHKPEKRMITPSEILSILETVIPIKQFTVYSVGHARDRVTIRIPDVDRPLAYDLEYARTDAEAVTLHNQMQALLFTQLQQYAAEHGVALSLEEIAPPPAPEPPKRPELPDAEPDPTQRKQGEGTPRIAPLVIPEGAYGIDIEVLGIPSRVVRALRRHRSIETVGDLLHDIKKQDRRYSALLAEGFGGSPWACYGIGESGRRELQAGLRRHLGNSHEYKPWIELYEVWEP